MLPEGPAQESLARSYVHELAMFDRVTLADNCFWKVPGKRKRPPQPKREVPRSTPNTEDLVRQLVTFVLNGGNLCALLHGELRHAIGDDGVWHKAMEHTKDAATQTPMSLEPALRQDVRILRTLLDSIPDVEPFVVNDAMVTAIAGGGVAIVYHRYKWAVRNQGADGESVTDNPFTEHFPLTQRAYHDMMVCNSLNQSGPLLGTDGADGEYILVGRGQWQPTYLPMYNELDALGQLYDEIAQSGLTEPHRDQVGSLIVREPQCNTYRAYACLSGATSP